MTRVLRAGDGVTKLDGEFNRIMTLADVREKLAKIGLDLAGGPPEQLAAYTKAERAKWAKVVKASGAKAD